MSEIQPAPAVTPAPQRTPRPTTPSTFYSGSALAAFGLFVGLLAAALVAKHSHNEWLPFFAGAVAALVVAVVAAGLHDRRLRAHLIERSKADR